MVPLIEIYVHKIFARSTVQLQTKNLCSPEKNARVMNGEFSV